MKLSEKQPRTKQSDDHREEILVIDDSLTSLDVLEGLLKEAGYRVRLATTGELALISLETHASDLILLDIKMPLNDGYTICRRIKANPDTVDIPIIFISALNKSDDIVKGFELGGVDFITKPFQAHEVLARVKNHLRLRRLQRELQQANEAFEAQVRARTIELQQANTALQKSELKYRRLTENARDVIYRMALPSGHYEYINPASSDLFGYTPDEFYTSPLLIQEVIHPDWASYFKGQWEKLLEGEVPFSYEYQIVHRSGETRWVYQRNVLVVDEDGSPTAIEGIVTDITERKQAEAALIKSEARHRTLVNTIPDLVWLKDANGVYLSCNLTFERFFGASEAEIVGKTDYDFIDRELADFFRKNDHTAMQANGPSINEEWLRFAENGYYGLFETIKTPMRGSDGTLVGVLGLARDVTARKEAEDALKENEQRYIKAQRMGKVGNWEYEIEPERFWGSDEAKRIYGFDPASKHFTAEEVEKCIPERKRVHQALVDLIESKVPYDLEFEIRPVSGPAKKIIKSIAEVIIDARGKPVKVVGVVQDITKQKKAEQVMLTLERQLRESQKMESIGNLAGGIAHDFNNILSAILGFTELVLDKVETGTIIEDSLQEVYAAGKRAKELVKQILAFARKSDEEVKPIQPSHITQEVLKFLRSSIPTSIEIIQHIESDAFIMGNATQFYQILLNLCTNAAQAMEDQGGVLEVNLKRLDLPASAEVRSIHLKGGSYIEIEVSDTGVGIPATVKDSIFEPYFSTKGPGEGTGLGLAMVLGIVETYGGKISVESTPGVKTAFTIFLPTTQKQKIAHEYESKRLPGGNEQILLVDDEAPITKLGSQILTRLGYSVTSRTNSEEVLALFSAEPNAFDLVITDMTMPKLTGDRLAVKMMAIRPDIPVILCTGYSKKISDETALTLGIKAIVYKPIVTADLANTVRKVLDEAWPAAQ